VSQLKTISLSMLLLIATASPVVIAGPTDVAPAAKNSSFCRRTLGKLALVTGLLLSPTVLYEVRELPQGHRHIGHGIYLDMENIATLAPPDVAEALKNPRENQRKIAEWLVSELNGDFDLMVQAFPELFPDAKSASSFFASSPDPRPLRGVCRHKAAILAAVLGHYGIESDVWVGQVNGQSVWHAWVEFSDGSLAIDPTEGKLEKPAGFRQGYHQIMRRNDYPLWWVLKFKK